MWNGAREQTHPHGFVHLPLAAAKCSTQQALAESNAEEAYGPSVGERRKWIPPSVRGRSDPMV
jgi:hypothetical protein